MNFSDDISAILLEQSNDIILITDSQGVIGYVNKQFEKVSGYRKEEVIGKTPSLLKSDKHKGSFYTKIWKDLRQNLPVQTTFINQKKNGDFFYQNTKIFPIDYTGAEGGFLSIGTDLTEQIRKIIFIETLTKEIQILNQDFDTFLYKVSHNLRAPLANMLGLMNIVELEVEDPKILSYCSMMARSTAQLDHILVDLVKVSVIRSATLSTQVINFSDLINEILRNLNKQFPVKKFTIHQDIQVSINHKLERIVLRNLIRPVLENAFQFRKYVPEQIKLDLSNHRVSIAIREESSHIFIQIEDNGIGIAEEQQQKIFDMFYKGSHVSNGSGLGLFIAKSALQRLQGETEIRSKLDEGTSFTFKIPHQ